MTSDNLWAPWRMAYINQLEAAERGPDPAAPPRCFLCEAAETDPDADQAARMLLLLSDQRGMVILNRFPYTSGHVLIAPREHLADLPDLTPQSRANLMELTVLAQQAIRAAYNPQGFNVGVNLGRCAGAGLPGHLHIHIVPRWSGDTNFMSVAGQVRVIPEALEQGYERLRKAMENLG